MSGAQSAANELHAAILVPMKRISAAVNQAREAREVMRETDDLMPTMGSVAGLILACEALQEAGKQAEAELRSALARVMAEVGATSVRTAAHTISLRDAPRRAVVTDTAALPPELMTQPAPKPDLTEIARRLRAGERIAGATLSNGGEQSIAIRSRSAA